MAACKDWEGCRGLSGECCPTKDGTMLACCDAAAPAAPRGCFGPGCVTIASDDTAMTAMCQWTREADQVEAKNNGCKPSYAGTATTTTTTHFSTPEISAAGRARVRLAEGQACNYAVDACRHRVEDVARVDFDVKAEGCTPDTWMAVYAFEANQWNASREIDFMETKLGGDTAGSESRHGIHTNWAGNAGQKTWRSATGQPLRYADGFHRHVTATFEESGDKRHVIVRHCDGGAETCIGDGQKADCNDPDTACRTLRFTPGATMKFVADIWQGPVGCTLEVSPLTVTTRR